MTYETSQFGDGVSTTRVANVHNHYGVRKSGQTVGSFKTEGGDKQLTLNITGEMLNRSDEILVAPVIPVGAVISKAIVQVTEVFDLGGTSPTILIGTQGSEVTNGLVISEANAESVQTIDVTGTLTGTWGSPIATAATVGIALGGTSPTAASTTGKMDVIIEYTKA